MELLNSIGSGAYFPITITPSLDSEGNPRMVQKMEQVGSKWVPVFDQSGNPVMIPATGWNPIISDPKLIKENLTQILLTQVGSRLREEDFGSRLAESIEEPNDSVQAFTIRDFIKQAISKYEPRITAYKVILEHQREFLTISLYYKINGNSSSIYNTQFHYNYLTNSFSND